MCHLIHLHGYRSIHTRVEHGSGARGRDLSMSSGSMESHDRQGHVNGVPVWNGDIFTL